MVATLLGICLGWWIMSAVIHAIFHPIKTIKSILYGIGLLILFAGAISAIL